MARLTDLQPADSPAWHWDSRWPAPAKINLFLHVVGQRADGYHLLETLFRFLDYGDTLRFAPRHDGQIVLETPLPDVPPETDLTVRAARCLQQASGCTAGASIWLDKRLPMGGGLGGGSSDAATVLLALNHLWQTGLSREQLQAIGLALGADVPVFVFGHNAFAQGVGETLQAVTLPAAWYLVLQPAAMVPTPMIFRAPELCRETPRLQGTLPDWQVGQLWGRNDLEPVACQFFPPVAAALAVLACHAPARMSGSGACVFAEFASEPAARTAGRAVQQACPGMAGWVAAGLAAHPLASL